MIGFRSHKKARASCLRAGKSAGKVPFWPFLFSMAWAAAVPAYIGWLRPWMLTWGATQAELDVTWPGDEMIARPRHVWTRAVTISAPPEAVWPWLVQMGQGRGGLYSYDWLENMVKCDIHSLSHIEPDLQQLAVDDKIRLVPEGAPADLYLLVAQMVSPETLVLVTPGSVDAVGTSDFPYMTWGFYLRPTSEGKTRLIARTRSVYRKSLGSLIANRIALEPIQFVMERRMLLGIKARAETTPVEQIG